MPTIAHPDLTAACAAEGLSHLATLAPPPAPLDPAGLDRMLADGVGDLGWIGEDRALRLDAASARAESPLFWPPPNGTTLDAVVGERESAEYFRQSRTIVEQWGRAGVVTKFGVVADANHFTAIAPLADPDSPMVARLKQLAQR